MRAAPLRLEVTEFSDADHWRWVLKDNGGAFLADHLVALDRAAPEYGALLDLPGYFYRYAAPDKRLEDERLLMTEVGAWITDRVLGNRIGQELLQRAAPFVVVRVIVPSGAERLAALPLELASIESRPLALRGISFVFEQSDAKQVDIGPVGESLRMLALFSVPPEVSPLNLRRERQALRELVRQLEGASGLSIELQVLQYGVIRTPADHFGASVSRHQ